MASSVPCPGRADRVPGDRRTSLSIIIHLYDGLSAEVASNREPTMAGWTLIDVRTIPSP